MHLSVNQRGRVLLLAIASGLRGMDPSRRYEATGDDGCFLDHMPDARVERCHDSQHVDHKSDDACNVACLYLDSHCDTSLNLFCVEHFTTPVSIPLHGRLLG